MPPTSVEIAATVSVSSAPLAAIQGPSTPFRDARTLRLGEGRQLGRMSKIRGGVVRTLRADLGKDPVRPSAMLRTWTPGTEVS